MYQNSHMGTRYTRWHNARTAMPTTDAHEAAMVPRATEPENVGRVPTRQYPTSRTWDFAATAHGRLLADVPGEDGTRVLPQDVVLDVSRDVHPNVHSKRRDSCAH